MSSAVSVIIPTRDRGGYLVEAVRSALAVPQSPAEIIVVDAGSTDGSLEEAAKLGGSVRTIRGTFRNAAASRNAGASEATGDYLGFLDSDDLLLPGKTTSLVEALAADPRNALVHGTTEVIGEDGEPVPEQTAAQNASFRKAQQLGTSYRALAGFCAMFTSATLIRKDAFESVGGYDESLDAYEDWDLYLRLSLEWRLTYANCPAARYRIWGGNVGWRRTAEWTIRVAEKHLAALPDLPDDERDAARYGFLRQLSASHHVLVERRAARRSALEAMRLAPRSAWRDRDIRRPLVRSFLPARLLHARRPEQHA
jgi:cellulose synthase/poly-beta-1,6-N-acetylglucosamine synthase-like glycosyltransferase